MMINFMYIAKLIFMHCPVSRQHFGREKIKEEAKEILRKATTPRMQIATKKQIRAKSAVERTTSSQRISTRSARRTTSTPRNPANTKLSFRGDPPPSFRIELDYLVGLMVHDHFSSMH